MSLYLCVDCGGTKTACVISDAGGAIVGRGSGGPSNITYLPVEQFIGAISEAIVEALKTALPAEASASEHMLPYKEGTTPFAAAWFGISGADSPAAIAKVTPAVSALVGIPAGDKLQIAHDAQLLAAPMKLYADVSYAVVVIAGTGSVAVGFKQGEGGKIEDLGRVGGWGWILGDEGGGYDVGRETLRHILREEDRASVVGRSSPPSVLAGRVLQKFGVSHPMEVFGVVYHGDPTSSTPSDESRGPDDLRRLQREKRISSLPRLVFQAAFEENDWLAKQILNTCAANLASQVTVILGEGMDTTSSKTVKADEAVISFGGSLVGNEKYRKLILDNLAGRGFKFPRVHYVDDAAATGAVALAAQYGSK
ncbi:hypothetical protein BKA70DRAFT_1261090 [Coprinopsis sp. MPI-PUGE-AT-0042]|nr:hypothetical protein BKA70DRAFT_1261090 [Coprinopsis sp. MPI-PUGE-AT-0042]